MLRCPIPCQIDVIIPLVSRHSAPAASLYCYICVNFCCFPFFPIMLTFFLGLSVSALFVSSLTHQLNIGLLVVSTLFLSSCLPSGLLVTSLCWSMSWTYHTTDRTSKQQSCPRNSACTLSGCLLCFLFAFPFFFVFFLHVFLLFYPLLFFRVYIKCTRYTVSWICSCVLLGCK